MTRADTEHRVTLFRFRRRHSLLVVFHPGGTFLMRVFKKNGFHNEPDWPKMGPSLLITTCLILAIRTAKWASRSSDSTASNEDVDREIEQAAFLAGRTFAHLVSKNPSIFPN